MLIQRVENHHFIDPVHKLRREVATGGLHSRALYLLVDLVSPLSQAVRSLLTGKADAAVYQLRHLTRTQIGRHNDYALRKINATVVAQSQRRFIENAEQ